MLSSRHPRWSVARAVVLAALLGLVPSVVGAQDATPLNPASQSAQVIADLFRFILWTALGVWVIVQGLILYAAIRFKRKNDVQPPQMHGNTRVEIAWTVAPAIVLLVILVYTVQTLGVTRFSGQADMTVEVIGHQWWWEYRYEGLDITTASDLVVPVNKSVLMKIKSADVIHSFWIPQLFGKTDANPTDATLTNWFKADKVGTFEGNCTEYCGEQHAIMRMRVVVLEQAEFDAWVRRQQQPAPTAATVERGKQLFLGSACIGCHAIKGTTAQGKVGPDLTNVGGRVELGAGALPMSQENLALWIGNAPAVKSGVVMPAFAQSAGGSIPDADLQAIAAYLYSLK
jgi:cytochrome c oxidase subunit II